MKLGVSHRRASHLNAEHLSFLRAMGVESLEARIHSKDATLDELLRIKEFVEGFGIELHEIMLEDLHNSPEICLGLPGRDEAMERLKSFIEDLGKAGIRHTTYCWFTGREPAFETERRVTRGCPTRGFDLEKVKAMPNAYDREYTEADMWAEYGRFIRDILPVAEKADVRLQLHPNDPPVDHQGVARIFKSADAFWRAMELSDFSPYNGLLFCVGCFSEMYGPDGKGEDIVSAIERFGSRNLIHQVHFRNTDCTLPDFAELFPDDGHTDMLAITNELDRIGFNGILVPDHVPDTSALEGGVNTGEAYAFGYIRALIQAAQSPATKWDRSENFASQS